MRLFVTGATGVVGRRAVPLLLSQGHSVTAGVRQTASRVGVAQKELDYVPVDLFDLARATPGCGRSRCNHQSCDTDAVIGMEHNVS